MNKFLMMPILMIVTLFSCLNQIRFFVRLGDPSSSQNWVYLSGLTGDFYSQQETKKIGKSWTRLAKS